MLTRLVMEYNTIMTLLLSGLICSIIILIFGFRIRGEKIQQILWDSKYVAITLLIILIIFIPFIFSKLIAQSLFSPYIFGIYLRELLISVLAVLFFAIGWFSSDYIARWYHSRLVQKVLQPFRTKQVSSNIQAPVTLQQSEQLVEQLNSVIIAFEEGLIDEDDAILAQEISSLEKWLVEEDITGFYELKEKVLYGDGLHSSTKIIIEQELDKLQFEKQTDKYSEKQRHLKFLLSFHVEMMNISGSNPEVGEAVNHNLALFGEEKRRRIESMIRTREVTIHDLQNPQWMLDISLNET